MFSAIVLLSLAHAAANPTPSSPAVTVIPFRTDAAPRVDPVFGDVASFRGAIDRFLTLQTQMDRVRDEFSSAVHATLAALASTSASAAERRPCPPAAGSPYTSALAAGGRYLALGQQLQASYRELRRSDDLGDTLGLTPDYRLKVKQAKDLHQHLLSDYREMRVAFYDQLGAEMRHAGCKLTAKGVATAPGTGPLEATDGAGANPVNAANLASPSNPTSNPTNLGAWELADPTVDGDDTAGTAAADRARPRSSERSANAASTAGTAPAVWIEVDNSLCDEPTRLSIDGQTLGDIGARNRTSVRARSGPHEVCALPQSDRRACGDAGTLRKAYLHEGWRVTIHCAP